MAEKAVPVDSVSKMAMHLRPTFVCFLVLTAHLCAELSSMSAQQSGLTSLATQRDQTRPLLIFAPKPDDSQMGIQLRLLNEHAAEAQDRQIVPIALPYNAPGPSDLQLSASEAETARRRFHVAPGDFQVILLGKDGGAKLRSSKPVPMKKLEETIDTMPMRQEEMHTRPDKQKEKAPS